MKRAQFLHIALMITVAMVSLRALAVARATTARQEPDIRQERAATKPAAPSINCVPAPSGLVSWWPFDGNANDYQLTHNAELANGAAFVPGEVDQALQLDGVDEFAFASPAPALNVGAGDAFTIDLWINPSDLSLPRPIVEWMSGVHIWQSVTFGGAQGPGNLYANIVDTSGASHIISSPPNTLQANTYQHVALVFVKPVSIALLYINGSIVATEAFGSVFTPETHLDLLFGLRPGVKVCFPGQMDEIDIYNRALSQSEIQAIHNAGSAGKCKTRLVTNANNGGAGSLRQAILESNAYGATNTIAFNIPGGGVHTISPASPLPVIRGALSSLTGLVTIDGTTQPGYSGAPLIELNGANAGSAFGLDCRRRVTIKGLVINRFTGGGIQLGSDGEGLDASGSTISGNYIGTDNTGILDLGNGENGIRIAGVVSNNTIGGTAPGARNIISGNGFDGIFIASSGNVVQGNYIGTDVSGNTSEFSACFQAGCGYAVSPASRFFTLRGGAGSVDVITSSACGWTASTPDNWIVIVSSNTGTGSQRVDFEVRENLTGIPRQGAINVQGGILTVIQDAGVGASCGYSISPRSNTFNAAGGTRTVTVTSSSACAWQAATSASWITITAGGAGIGNGAVSYTVAANPGPTGRNGAITIAGLPFSIKQKAP